MARGGGKTTFVAAICAALVDGPLVQPRAESVLVASSFEQAMIAFRHTLAFLQPKVDADPLRFRVQDSVNRASITDRETGAMLRCLHSPPPGFALAYSWSSHNALIWLSWGAGPGSPYSLSSNTTTSSAPAAGTRIASLQLPQAQSPRPWGSWCDASTYPFKLRRRRANSCFGTGHLGSSCIASKAAATWDVVSMVARCMWSMIHRRSW